MDEAIPARRQVSGATLRNCICAATFFCPAWASAQAVSALDVANALARNTAISSRPAAIIDSKEAARRLGKAQLARSQGAQPLPGERAGSAGASVVNHRYWQRQEKLRRAVEQAQHRSQLAQR
jgi:ribosomal protein L19E